MYINYYAFYAWFHACCDWRLVFLSKPLDWLLYSTGRCVVCKNFIGSGSSSFGVLPQHHRPVATLISILK